MLSFVQESYDSASQKMEELKAQNKTKTVTYRELMGSKLIYKNILDMYKQFDLI